MPEAPYDFAVFGSTPLAALLAGLLATVHRKRVCVVGEASSAFRLPRSADLSVMPVTRPETWALLRETTPEVLKLLGRIRARAGMTRIDPIFVAETPAGADGLAHMRHVALANGYAVERLADGAGTGGIAYRLRDAVLLRRAELEPILAGWLEKSGVGQLSRPDVVATVRRDGTVRRAPAHAATSRSPRRGPKARAPRRDPRPTRSARRGPSPCSAGESARAPKAKRASPSALEEMDRARSPPRCPRSCFRGRASRR